MKLLQLFFAFSVCACPHLHADIESISYVTPSQDGEDVGAVKTFRKSVAEKKVTLDALLASRQRSDVKTLLTAYDVLKNFSNNGPENPSYTPGTAIQVLQGAINRNETIALNEVDVISSRAAAILLLKQFEQSPQVVNQYATFVGAGSERELNQAILNRDLMAVEAIGERYPLSRASLKALNWKASYHLDRAEWASAIRSMELIKERQLDEIARRTIDVQLALAYARSGKRKKATTLMEQFENEPYIVGNGAKLTSVDTLPAGTGNMSKPIPTKLAGCVPAPHADEWNTARMLPGTSNQLMLASKKGEVWKVNLDTGATELVRAFARLVPYQFSANGKSVLASAGNDRIVVVGLESDTRTRLNLSSDIQHMNWNLTDKDALSGIVAFASKWGEGGKREEESHILSLTTRIPGVNEIKPNEVVAPSTQLLLRRWTVSTGTAENEYLDIRKNGSDHLYLSRDGKVLVGRNQVTGRSQIWRLGAATAEELNIALPAHPGNMELIGLSQNGNTVVFGNSQGKISVVDVDRRDARGVAPEAEGLSSMGVSPDGSLSAWGTGSGNVVIRGVARDMENLRTELPGIHPGGVRAIQIEAGNEQSEQRPTPHFILSFGAVDNKVCVTRVASSPSLEELKPLPQITLDYSTAKRPLPIRRDAGEVPNHQPY